MYLVFVLGHFYRPVLTTGRRKKWSTETGSWKEGVALKRSACWVWKERQGTAVNVYKFIFTNWQIDPWTRWLHWYGVCS